MEVYPLGVWLSIKESAICTKSRLETTGKPEVVSGDSSQLSIELGQTT
jgi:hypothetical protein